MNIGEILTKSWQIVWKNKVLWIFGILAGCASGGGGGGGGSNSGYRYSDGGNGENPFSQFAPQMEQFGRFFEQNPWIIIVIIAVLCILLIIFKILGTIGKIGLIKGTLAADEGVEHQTFGELWNGSLPYFWRVFGLSILAGLAIFVAMMIFFMPFAVIGALTMGIGLLCLFPILCLFIPVSWAISLVLEQAVIAIVAEDAGISAALGKGWQVVRNNVGPMILVSLTLFVVGIIAGILLFIPMLLAGAPLIASFMLEGTVAKTALIAGIACLVIFIPVLIVINGIIAAYLQAAWTLTYKRLTTPTNPVITGTIETPEMETL